MFTVNGRAGHAVYTYIYSSSCLLMYLYRLKCIHAFNVYHIQDHLTPMFSCSQALSRNHIQDHLTPMFSCSQALSRNHIQDHVTPMFSCSQALSRNHIQDHLTPMFSCSQALSRNGLTSTATARSQEMSCVPGITVSFQLYSDS